MTSGQPPSRNLTGLFWYIDVHVIDRPDAADLRKMHELGWVYLQVTDTAMTEVSGAQDPANRDRIIDDMRPFPVSMGPTVLDHSLLDYSVGATDEDTARIEAVYDTLWPSNDIDQDRSASTRAGQTRFRDALHVATADRRMLAGADRIAERFDGFALLSIDSATGQARKRVAQVRRRARLTGRPNPADLPDWP